MSEFLGHLSSSPGSFESDIEYISGTLNSWVTTEELLKELVELVFTQVRKHLPLVCGASNVSKRSKCIKYELKCFCLYCSLLLFLTSPTPEPGFVTTFPITSPSAHKVATFVSCFCNGTSQTSLQIESVFPISSDLSKILFKNPTEALFIKCNAW